MRDQIIPATLSGRSLEQRKVDAVLLQIRCFFLHLVLFVVVLVVLDRPVAGVHAFNELRINDQPLFLPFLQIDFLPNISVHLLSSLLPFVHVDHGVVGVDGLLRLPPQDLVGHTLGVLGHAVFDLTRLGRKVRLRRM